MASQYEAGTAWTVERLRTSDATFLQGTYRPANLPLPVAIARGGISNNAGAVGAGDTWVLDTTIPAQDSIAWVVVQDNILMQPYNAVSDLTPVSVYWFPQGNNALGTALTAPALGPGKIDSAQIVANGGTYLWTAVPAVPAPRTTWVPLDPENTISGVATTLVVEANATTGPGVGDWRVNMEGCTMLGFPVNLWGTGELWIPMSSRGS